MNTMNTQELVKAAIEHVLTNKEPKVIVLLVKDQKIGQEVMQEIINTSPRDVTKLNRFGFLQIKVNDYIMHILTPEMVKNRKFAELFQTFKHESTIQE